MFYTTTPQSPLGPLYAVADNAALLYLGFEPFQSAAAQKSLFRSLIKNPTSPTQSTLKFSQTKATSWHSILQEQKNDVLLLLERELALFFNHQLTTFTVPIKLIGSPFQQAAWQVLTTIPYGQTLSYTQQAALLGKPRAYRAVGNANGANNMVIVVPCHRVIGADGGLGGYTGGLEYKSLLLKHETKNLVQGL